MESSDNFREQLRYAAYGAQTVHPQDIQGVRAWNRILDDVAERLWKEAFDAGVIKAAQDSLIWNFPKKEE